MKLDQFQSMVRIEYTEGEEATAVVRLPVLAASEVLLTGGLNVYWASSVLALPEPLKYTYKGMPKVVEAKPKPTEQPDAPAVAPAAANPTAPIALATSSKRNFGWTGIARVLAEHIIAERKQKGLPELTEKVIESITVNPMGVVEVDLIAFLKSLKFPSGVYCFRRATPMDKLLVQPAPNRVLKQEHLDLLYHQLLYIQQELCEVKFIPAEVVRDGTYNGGVLEDPKVTPDPEQPNTGDTGGAEPKPKPQPEPDVDTETQAVPMAEHLTTQGYTIAYIHNGVPVIFGKAPFKLNKRGQQIDSNGYLTLSQTDTQLRVLNKATAFTTYEAAVGTRPEASVLDAAGYTKDSAGKYYAVLPRIQTTVLPSNSPNGRFEEVYKDANGYSIEYTAEAGTGNYKWFVRLAEPKVKPEDNTGHSMETQPAPPAPNPPEPNPEPKQPENNSSPVEPRPEPAPEHREEPRPAEPAPERRESGLGEDRGAVIKEVHTSADLPRYKKRNAGDNMRAYGYTEDSHYNYPAIAPITKYVAADDAPEDLKGILPLVLDKNGSVLQWAIETNRELPGQPTVAYWAVEYDPNGFY